MLFPLLIDFSLITNCSSSRLASQDRRRRRDTFNLVNDAADHRLGRNFAQNALRRPETGLLVIRLMIRLDRLVFPQGFSTWSSLERPSGGGFDELLCEDVDVSPIPVVDLIVDVRTGSQSLLERN